MIDRCQTKSDATLVSVLYAPCMQFCQLSNIKVLCYRLCKLSSELVQNVYSSEKLSEFCCSSSSSIVRTTSILSLKLHLNQCHCPFDHLTLKSLVSIYSLNINYKFINISITIKLESTAILQFYKSLAVFVQQISNDFHNDTRSVVQYFLFNSIFFY